MTEDEEREWQERLRAAVEATLRKRASRARFRAEHTEARKWGKRALHVRKLAHFKQQEETSMTEQYEAVERIAMSHGLHVQRVDLYQVVNVKREVVFGTVPMTLDQVAQTFDATLAQLDQRRKNAQAIIDAKVEAGELIRTGPGLVRKATTQERTAHDRANAARLAWEAEHLGPNGDFVDLGAGRVIERANYDPEKHGLAIGTKVKAEIDGPGSWCPATVVAVRLGTGEGFCSRCHCGKGCRDGSMCCPGPFVGVTFDDHPSDPTSYAQHELTLP